jgi:uncharacterized protein (DUF362 family)
MKEKKYNRYESFIHSALSRRRFLEYQMKGTLFLASGMSGLIFPKNGFSNGTPDIGIAKGESKAATRAAVELVGGIKKFVKSGNRVLIKPNMSFPNPPAMASTTNPEVVRELAIMCREAGASNILVADYPLGRSTELCLSQTGIRDACKDIDNVSVAAFSNDRFFRDTAFTNAKTMRHNGVLKEALRADVLIAVPVAKSHSSTGVSLSMKGMMGLVWNRQIMHRQGLSSTIVDMCEFLKADLTIIDGTRVLSTNGPGGPGKVLKENTIIASGDMVAADACAASRFKWSGKKYKPRQVAYIKEAHERGLGRMDIENLVIKEIEV